MPPPEIGVVVPDAGSAVADVGGGSVPAPPLLPPTAPPADDGRDDGRDDDRDDDDDEDDDDDDDDDDDGAVAPFEWLTDFSRLSSVLSPSRLFPASPDGSGGGAVAGDGVGDGVGWLRRRSSSSSSSSPSPSSPSPPRRSRRALHVGCGTSALGERMVDSLGYGLVVNADRDSGALRAAERRWRRRRRRSAAAAEAEAEAEAEAGGGGSAMRWLLMDFASPPPPGASRPTEPTAASPTSAAPPPPPYPPGYFDVVVDKSTLDCALCSEDDAASGLICVAHDSLRPDGGAYVVISFHPPGFISPLLGECPGTDWDVEHAIVGRENLPAGPRGGEVSGAVGPDGGGGGGAPPPAWRDGAFDPTDEYRRYVNVFVCRRGGGGGGRPAPPGEPPPPPPPSSYPLDRDSVRSHVRRTGEVWFRELNPLVTRRREEDLRAAFDERLLGRRAESKRSSPSVRAAPPPTELPLGECYYVLFTDAEREHLTYEHFLEDWGAFVGGRGGRNDDSVGRGGMCVEVAIRFLEEMQ